MIEEEGEELLTNPRCLCDRPLALSLPVTAVYHLPLKEIARVAAIARWRRVRVCVRALFSVIVSSSFCWNSFFLSFLKLFWFLFDNLRWQCFFNLEFSLAANQCLFVACFA